MSAPFILFTCWSIASSGGDGGISLSINLDVSTICVQFIRPLCIIVLLKQV